MCTSARQGNFFNGTFVLKFAFHGSTKSTNCKPLIDWNEWMKSTLKKFSGYLTIFNKLENIYSNKSIEISKLFAHEEIWCNKSRFQCEEMGKFLIFPMPLKLMDLLWNIIPTNPQKVLSRSRNLKCIWDSLVIFQINRISIEGKSEKIENIFDD